MGTRMKQDGDQIHKELLDGCLLLSEERLPEKGAQSEEHGQGGYKSSWEQDL